MPPPTSKPSDTEIKGTVRAIVEGRPFKIPQNPDEKAKLIEALHARATAAVLDHQPFIVDRIKKVVLAETKITEKVFLKSVRDAAEKEAAQIIQEEGSGANETAEDKAVPEFDGEKFLREEAAKKEKEKELEEQKKKQYGCNIN